MKRIFAMLLCALLVCGMAVAVAEEPAATGKLVLYSPLTTSMIENMLAMFEAALEQAMFQALSAWGRL